MIAENINKQIVEAMKAKDDIRLSTLKLLSSELHNAKIDKREDLNEEEEMAVVRREAKKRKDAIDAYNKAGAKGREEKEKKELEILKEFLPKEIPNAELEKMVEDAIKESGAKDIKDMGRIIGIVISRVDGKAEGGKIAGIVKDKLTN